MKPYLRVLGSMAALLTSSAALAEKTDYGALSRAAATEKTSAWAACLVLNTRMYTTSGESAELVVDAAFGECSSHEGPVRTAVLGMHMRSYLGVAGGIEAMAAVSAIAADRSLDDLRAGYRGKLLGLVMDERSAANTNQPIPARP